MDKESWLLLMNPDERGRGTEIKTMYHNKTREEMVEMMHSLQDLNEHLTLSLVEINPKSTYENIIKEENQNNSNKKENQNNENHLKVYNYKVESINCASDSFNLEKFELLAQNKDNNNENLINQNSEILNELNSTKLLNAN